MLGLVLCLPRVEQPHGLPVPHETPKNPLLLYAICQSPYNACKALGREGYGFISNSQFEPGVGFASGNCD